MSTYAHDDQRNAIGEVMLGLIVYTITSDVGPIPTRHRRRQD